MTFDPELHELMEDSITIEPWESQDADLKPTYGAAATYSKAIVELHEKRHTDSEGREFQSSVRVLLPGRLVIDKRSRVTLPEGFEPRQPAIRSIFAHKALGLDHTVLVFGAGGEFSAQ
jgi:hypothetical protein